MIIRHAQFADADRIYDLEVNNFSSPWSLDNLKKELETQNNDHLYYVVENDNDVIAFIGIWILYDEAHIMSIVVDKAFKKKGIATKLLSEILKNFDNKIIKKMLLEVRNSNLPAIKLYEKLEFKQLYIRKNYYTAPIEDAIVMELNL